MNNLHQHNNAKNNSQNNEPPEFVKKSGYIYKKDGHNRELNVKILVHVKKLWQNKSQHDKHHNRHCTDNNNRVDHCSFYLTLKCSLPFKVYGEFFHNFIQFSRSLTCFNK